MGNSAKKKGDDDCKEFFLTEDKIKDSIKKCRAKKIAVTCIGEHWQDTINPQELECIIISPTEGTNPESIKSLVEELADPENSISGWEKVFFLEELHTNIYLGNKLAVISSTSLTDNSLTGEHPLELCSTVKDKASLRELDKSFALFLERAKKEDCNTSQQKKQIKLDELLDKSRKLKKYSRLEKYSENINKSLGTRIRGIKELVVEYFLAALDDYFRDNRSYFDAETRVMDFDIDEIKNLFCEKLNNGGINIDRIDKLPDIIGGDVELWAEAKSIDIFFTTETVATLVSKLRKQRLVGFLALNVSHRYREFPEDWEFIHPTELPGLLAEGAGSALVKLYNELSDDYRKRVLFFLKKCRCNADEQGNITEKIDGKCNMLVFSMFN